MSHKNMYIGHFAFGLALKSTKPEVPILPILLATTFMDILCGFLIAIGIEHITPNLSSGPYVFFDFKFIDWSHSLLMSIIFSCLSLLIFWSNRIVAFIVSLALFSHFFLDLPFHNLDIALYPYSDTHLGMKLWEHLGVVSWVLEGLFSVVLIVYAWTKKYNKNGVLLWSSVYLGISFIILSPWFSPNLLLAKLPIYQAQLSFGVSLVLAYLLPVLLFYLIDNYRDSPS